MNIGVLKEIKVHEYRVGLTPASVSELVQAEHQVFVEHNAGASIGFTDEDYQQAGAKVLDKASVFLQASLIIKVKEPELSEVSFFQPHHILFTFLHLAANQSLTEALLKQKCTCFAYETVKNASGALPLLEPMSAVAGRIAIQAGAMALQKFNGGAGILLGGIPGVKAALVVILGGGIVGRNAAQMALGLGANVVVLDKNLDLLRKIDQQFDGQVDTIYSTFDAISEYVRHADLLIGSVLIPGASAPKLVTNAHIKTMKPGSAVVDVAIDQGGCFETSKPTTHEKATYLEHGVVHYCVTNMPGAVPKTSTQALNNATLPYILLLAKQWHEKSLLDKGLLNGLNIYQGKITNEQVAKSLNLPFTASKVLL